MKTEAGSLFVLSLFLALISCEDPVSTKKADGVFAGEIKSAASGQSVYPVYIFEGDSLLCIVDRNNHYSIRLNYGDHEIIFSAIGYLDEVVPVSINGDQGKEIKLSENAAD